jgi:signal transduction histidine kinase/HAMP domain-containing protein
LPFDLSLRVKLILALSVVFGIGAVAFALWFPARMDKLARQGLEDRASGIAVLLGSACATGIEFGDTEFIETELSRLSEIPEARTAAVYLEDGSLAAAWKGELGAPNTMLPPDAALSTHIESGLLIVVHRIDAKMAKGTLRVGLSLERYQQAKRDNLWTAAVATLILFAVGLVVSLFVGSVLVRPLQQLVRTTRAVTAGELSLEALREQGGRADRYSRDEAAQLTAVLGEMAGRIARQVKALETERERVGEANARLEDDVAARTAELREALAERQATLDHLVDGLIAVDERGMIDLANPATSDLFERAEGFVGASAEEVLPADLYALIKRASSASDSVTGDIQLSNDRVATVAASAVRSDGSEHGVVVLIRDTTLEREVDRMKTEFIATVSHELRTPLTSVLGFAKLTAGRLEDRVFNHVPDDDRKGQRAVKQVRANMKIIVAEGQRLTALINDVLDISKMEAGRTDWVMEPVAPDELVQRAVDATRSLFVREGGPEFVTNVEADLPRIVGDFNRLVQVLINLISNAAKFTDEGSVTVGAVARDGLLELSVTDTGDGIDASQHDLVFERFRQVGDTLTNKPKGTGLGLPICRRIVVAHHGRIGLESALGEGSRFFVLLPLPNEVVSDVVPQAK